MRFSERGFTLIEICIVLVVMGLVVAGFARTYKVFLAQSKQTKQEETYNIVRESLRNFIYRDIDPDPVVIDTLGRYPCPADPAAAPGTASYGVEQRNDGGNPNVATAECVQAGGITVVGTAPNRVFIGSVPTRTLEIASSHMLDAYGNRMSYAVTEALARQKGAVHQNVPGIITIDPTTAGPAITNAHFALVSHGPDGAGSYTADGVLNPHLCDGDNQGDSENCDGDAVFSELAVALADTPAYYDDALAFTLAAGKSDQFWGAIDDNPQNIKNLNPSGMVWIGQNPNVAAYAGQSLVVSGNSTTTQDFQAGADVNVGGNVNATAAVSAGTTVTAGGNISAGANINAAANITAGGNIIATGLIMLTATCPSGQFLTGIANGQAQCATPASPSPQPPSGCEPKGAVVHTNPNGDISLWGKMCGQANGTAAKCCSGMASWMPGGGTLYNCTCL